MNNSFNVGVYGESYLNFLNIQKCLKKYFFKKDIQYNVSYIDSIYSEDESFDVVFVDMHSLMNEIRLGIEEIKNKIRCYIIAIADSVEELMFAFRIKAFQAIKKKFQNNDIEYIMEEVIGTINRNDRVIVDNGDERMLVDVNEILYIEALGDNSIIVTSDDSYLNNKPLKYWENYFKDLFCRIHKSYIISIDKIKKLDDKFVYLRNSDDLKLQVAVRRRKQLVDIIKKLSN